MDESPDARIQDLSESPGDGSALDLIAHDRGLKRLAASLYEFEPARHP